LCKGIFFLNIYYNSSMCDIINVKNHIFISWVNQKFSDDRPSLVPLPQCSFKPIKPGIESIERDVSRSSSVHSNKCARLISENEETCKITTAQQNTYHKVKGKHI